ncbi:unnamed protein product, partial [Mesorhabditis spiculigera]
MCCKEIAAPSARIDTNHSLPFSCTKNPLIMDPKPKEGHDEPQLSPFEASKKTMLHELGLLESCYKIEKTNNPGRADRVFVEELKEKCVHRCRENWHANGLSEAEREMLERTLEKEIAALEQRVAGGDQDADDDDYRALREAQEGFKAKMLDGLFGWSLGREADVLSFLIEKAKHPERVDRAFVEQLKEKCVHRCKEDWHENGLSAECRDVLEQQLNEKLAELEKRFAETDRAAAESNAPRTLQPDQAFHPPGTFTEHWAGLSVFNDEEDHGRLSWRRRRSSDADIY